MSNAPATTEQLSAYLQRIGFEGIARPDIETLRKLHRAHVEAIPYENLDVQLGRRVTRHPQDAFDKIVNRGRGGWCYEMNGLFGWMLEAIGFRVTRLAGAVMREIAGDRTIGNHLVLLVDLGETWVADVGLGNGLVEPARLAAGPVRQRFMEYELQHLDDGWWRFLNHKGSLPPSFDFSPAVTDEALLEERCGWLQSDPGSPFVMNAIAQRQFADRTETIVGPVHTTFTPEGQRVRTISDAADYLDTVSSVFGLTIPELELLWPKIEACGTAGFEPPGE